jgi:hypothetical protein
MNMRRRARCAGAQITQVHVGGGTIGGTDER